MTEDILIVDDNPANIHLLAGLLRKRGFKIRKATPASRLAFRRCPVVGRNPIHLPPDFLLATMQFPRRR